MEAETQRCPHPRTIGSSILICFMDRVVRHSRAGRPGRSSLKTRRFASPFQHDGVTRTITANVPEDQNNSQCITVSAGQTPRPGTLGCQHRPRRADQLADWFPQRMRLASSSVDILADASVPERIPSTRSRLSACSFRISSSIVPRAMKR